MREVLDVWFFIIVISVTLVISVPLFVVWFVLQLSPELRLAATIVIIIVWGIVSGYKYWIIAKQKEEEEKSAS